MKSWAVEMLGRHALVAAGVLWRDSPLVAGALLVAGVLCCEVGRDRDRARVIRETVQQLEDDDVIRRAGDAVGGRARRGREGG